MALDSFKADKLAAKLSKANVATPTDWETSVTGLDTQLDTDVPAMVAASPQSVQDVYAANLFNADRALNRLLNVIAEITGLPGVSANDGIDTISAWAGYLDTNKAAMAASITAAVRTEMTATEMVRFMADVAKERS